MKFYIDTPLSPAEAIARIRGSIYMGTATRRSKMGRPYQVDFPFTGSVSAAAFQIQWVDPMYGVSTAQPILDGRVGLRDIGARLVGDIRQPASATVPTVVLFLVMLLMALVVIRKSLNSGDILGVAIPAAILAGSVATVWWARRLGPRGSCKALAALVDGVVID